VDVAVPNASKTEGALLLLLLPLLLLADVLF